MDFIQGLTIKELIAIAYENRCFKCLDSVYDGRRGGNYWGCNQGCGRKCCDNCKDEEDDEKELTDEEKEKMDTDGYICEHCSKNQKKADDSK